MNANNALSKSWLGQKISLILASIMIMTAIMINVLPFQDGRNDLMDFGSFYASGIKSKNGENPYDPNSNFIFEVNFSRVGAGGKMVNLNPPISIGIFEYVSQFDAYRSMSIWQIVSMMIYAGSIFLLVSAYRENTSLIKFLWTFSLAGFWHTLVLGQIYAILLLLTVLSWIFLQKGKYGLAGIALGLLICIKPNFILWPIFLLVSGYLATALISTILGLVISLIPVLFYGTSIYSQWLAASALRLQTLIMPGNNSILGLTARFDSIPIGVILSIVAVLTLLFLSRFKISPPLEKFEYVSALGIIASLLASPISWTGYTIFLLPIFFSLKKWTVSVMLAAVILAIPFLIVLQLFQNSFTNFVIFGWLYGWAILLLVGDVVRNSITTRSIQTS